MFKKVIDGFAYPFSPDLFYTVRGCENVHIYFWICKDLGWILGNKPVGMLFGTLALGWIGVLISNHWVEKNYEDIYFILPTFLWLGGNYLWMSGNLLYNSDVYRFPASCIMMVGILLIIFYFAFLKKKKFFVNATNTTDPPNPDKYVTNGLVCKFKSIGTWKRYEFVHMFFWLLKDYCWCCQDKLMWLSGAIATLYISGDLILVTWKNKGLLVDFAHYLSQLIWVSSNITWAFCELFVFDSDGEPKFKPHSHPTGRYIATIILIIAWIPIICLYCIWLPLSLMKKIKLTESELNTQTHQIQQINPIHLPVDDPDINL